MNKLLSKSFLWMFVGLMVTFITGYVVASSEDMLYAIFDSSLYWIFALVELALVIFFSARVHKMSPSTATVCFLLYSFINGLTFSIIFVAFELATIIYVFLIAAIVFAIFGLIGYFTDYDLSGWGTYLLMGLIGIVICAIINIFLGNSTFDLIVCIIGLVIFVIYTAYDVQKIKSYSENGMDNDVVAINGAFELYLDFINIFIRILSLIGDSRD